MNRLALLILLSLSILTIPVSADYVLTSPLPLPLGTQNGGFEANFNDWAYNFSSISLDAHSGQYSALLGTNDYSKTYVEQIVLPSTRSGNYTFSFWVKNSDGHVANRNQLDVEFNNMYLNTSGTLANWPIYNVELSNWTFFLFESNQGVEALHITEPNTADLRIRFHGRGFVLDDVTVTVSSAPLAAGPPSISSSTGEASSTSGEASPTSGEASSTSGFGSVADVGSRSCSGIALASSTTASTATYSSTTIDSTNTEEVSSIEASGAGTEVEASTASVIELAADPSSAIQASGAGTEEEASTASVTEVASTASVTEVAATSDASSAVFSSTAASIAAVDNSNNADSNGITVDWLGFYQFGRSDDICDTDSCCCPETVQINGVIGSSYIDNIIATYSGTGCSGSFSISGVTLPPSVLNTSFNFSAITNSATLTPDSQTLTLGQKTPEATNGVSCIAKGHKINLSSVASSQAMAPTWRLLVAMATAAGAAFMIDC